MREGHIEKHGYNEHREYGEHGEMNINGVKEGSSILTKALRPFVVLGLSHFWTS